MIFGPNMQNAADIRDEIVERKLGWETSSEPEIAIKAFEVVTDGGERERVREESTLFFNENRGAVATAIHFLEDLKVIKGGAE